MPVLPPIEKPEGVAIASGAVLFALLDVLVAKNVIDKDDVRSLLNTARNGVGARMSSPGGPDAISLIGMLGKHFA